MVNVCGFGETILVIFILASLLNGNQLLKERMCSPNIIFFFNKGHPILGWLRWSEQEVWMLFPCRKIAKHTWRCSHTPCYVVLFIVYIWISSFSTVQFCEALTFFVLCDKLLSFLIFFVRSDVWLLQQLLKKHFS